MHTRTLLRQVALRVAMAAATTLALAGLMLPPAAEAAPAKPAAPTTTASGGSALDSATKQFEDTGHKAGIQSNVGPDAFPKIIGGFIKQAIGLLGIILVVLIIYAGFLWMTAQGNEDKVKKAKAIISNAVVGMVLIFAAYALTDWVIAAIVSGTQPS